MNDLGKQVCKCIVGACDDTCKYYDAEKSCCVGYEEVVQQAEKVFSEYESYKDLEEQNRLIKLPCAVGDTAYSFSFEKILTLCVDSFVIYTDGIYARLSSKMKEYEFLKIDMDIADFGEKWFSTKEEAESALKELERGKGND